MEKVFVTLDRFKLLKQEVKNLKTKGRKKIADKLSQYRDTVDLLEDSTYNDVLEEQAILEEKIHEIEQLLENASIIKVSRSTKIHIGSRIVIRMVGSRKDMKISIVGSIDADPALSHVSNESPLGQALLGKKKDDIVELQVGGKTIKYKIIEVK